MAKRQDDKTVINSCNKRLERLRSDRSHMMDYWGELSDYHLSHRGRFLLKQSDRNNNTRVRRNTKQINNASRMACRTLASGMMAGITSPARPWFKLSTSDPALSEFSAVKEWLHDVETLMYRVFSQSNIYNCLHQLYSEIGPFGTSAMGVYGNYDNVIHCKTYTVGSYMLDTGADNAVDTMYWETEYTVGQLVKKFGIDNVSTRIKDMWGKGNTETLIPCVQVIEPNDDRDSLSPFAEDQEYRFVVYEADQGGRDSAMALTRSGFFDFPIMAPRWEVVGEEVYAQDCPGMTALGDTKALQLGEKRMYQAIDKIANPPLQGDPNLSAHKTTPAPGSVVPKNSTGVGLESIYGNYRPDVGALMSINLRTEERVRKAFYEDLFLMMINSDRRQITATEVAEKHEEKLLMLGPVLERLHYELLDPLITRVFGIMTRSGIIPQAPEELEGTEMTVEYVSILAQAQRMVGVSSIERTIGFAMNAGNMWREATHKINISKAIEEHGTRMGLDPEILRGDDEVEGIMAAEQQAVEQQRQMDMAQQSAGLANTAANTPVEDTTMLNTMLRNAGMS